MMRNLLRSMADGCLTATNAIYTIALHFSLLTIFKSQFQQPSVLQHYRPVYSRSGRRNRVRC